MEDVSVAGRGSPEQRLLPLPKALTKEEIFAVENHMWHGPYGVVEDQEGEYRCSKSLRPDDWCQCVVRKRVVRDGMCLTCVENRHDELNAIVHKHTAFRNLCLDLVASAKQPSCLAKQKTSTT